MTWALRRCAAAAAAALLVSATAAAPIDSMGSDTMATQDVHDKPHGQAEIGSGSIGILESGCAHRTPAPPALSGWMKLQYKSSIQCTSKKIELANMANI